MNARSPKNEGALTGQRAAFAEGTKPRPLVEGTWLPAGANRLSPAALLRLQRSVGNRSVVRLLARSKLGIIDTGWSRSALRSTTSGLSSPYPPEATHGRPAALQRMGIGEAIKLASERGINASRFHGEILPILTSMARKVGVDIHEYLQALPHPKYLALLNEISVRMPIQNVGSPATHPIACEPSKLFPGLYVVTGTNIYVDSGSIVTKTTSHTTPPTGIFARWKSPVIATTRHSALKPPAEAFAQSILHGGSLQWYRGMGMNHFAWDGLLTGYLASEGTSNTPNFTMATSGPLTRWLPGATGEDGMWTALSVGASVQEEGLAALWEKAEVVVGVVLQYVVTPATPIAFMNGNEQLLRGPLGAPHLSVALLAVRNRGQTAIRVPSSKQVQHLPPRYPYQAELGSPAFIAWAQSYDNWAEVNSVPGLVGMKRALVPSEEPSPSAGPDLSLRTAFAILGIPFSDAIAPSVLIHRYRQLALKHHPDRNAADQEAAKKKFQDVWAAYTRIKEGAENREIKLIKGSSSGQEIS